MSADTTGQKPSLCRAVIYKDPQYRAHGARYIYATNSSKDTAATIVGVRENGNVDLFITYVDDNCGGYAFVCDVEFGTGPGQWSWPPRC